MVPCCFMKHTIATNLRIPAQTYQAIRLLARSRGQSIAALVREALAIHVETGGRGAGPAAGDDPFMKVVGIAVGGPPDLARRHDRYLYGGPGLRRARRTRKG